MEYLSFWLNSVVVHTLNEQGKTAPIVFVGTRKDKVCSPSDHQAISQIIYEKFGYNICWPHVIENTEGVNTNGQVSLCFFPVDNTAGRNDPTLRRLLQEIEKVIDGSDYVHVDHPLSWFKDIG